MRNVLHPGWIVVVAITYCSPAADLPKVPVPASPFIGVVYQYADTMIERGRDSFGPIKSGLLVSALDRASLSLLTNRPPAPPGVREEDRASGANGLTGANLQHDQNLYRLLYFLSDLSAKPKYRAAADEALRWFFEKTASPAHALLSLGNALTWDVLGDLSVSSDAQANAGCFRPWMLWGRSFAIAPGATKQAVVALGQSPLARDHPRSAREAGFRLRTWAEAYAFTGEAQFLTNLTAILNKIEVGDEHPENRQGARGWAGYESAAMLSLAIDCAGAAQHLPEAIAARLRRLAEQEDIRFCSRSHELTQGRGFVLSMPEIGEIHPTPLWEAGSGKNTTAQIAMLCVSRYENSGYAGYRPLIEAAADLYRAPVPSDVTNLWPVTLGQAIALQLAAWRSTANVIYLDQARVLGNFAVARFFDGRALPRAALGVDHYEAITGADTLALALADLHLHILAITAVRCPSNTIDR